MFLTIISTCAYSQLLEFKPVIVERNSGNVQQQQNIYQQQQNNYYRTQPSRPSTPSYSTTGAYYIDRSTNRFVRVKIRYTATDDGYGHEVVYLKGLYFSNMDTWQNYNIRAQRVSGISDSQIIKENFEWKVYNTYHGTLYFNL